MEYRIKKITYKSNDITYKVQWKFLYLFWVNTQRVWMPMISIDDESRVFNSQGSCHSNLEDAKKEIAYHVNSEVSEIKIINLYLRR